MIRFDRQVALVTGAGRGLGRAYAVLLAERGAHVVVHDAGVDLHGEGSDRAVAESVVHEIRAAGGRADPAFEDLDQRGASTTLVERTARDHGRLDVLIHSAGISIHAGLADTDDATLDRVIAINGRAAIELLRAAYPVMAPRRYGRVVLTVSGHGLYPGEEGDLVAYGASKAMQFGLLNSVAAEFARVGILVNAVSPVAATRMLTRDVAPDELQPEDVAPGVVYLASPECTASGVVMRAANGRFSIGRYAVNDGVDLKGAMPEAVAAAWDRIVAGPYQPAGEVGEIGRASCRERV